MIRNILVVIFAIVLSFVLISIGTYIMLNSTTFGDYVKDYHKQDNKDIDSLEKKHGHLFNLIDDAEFYTKIVMFPLLAVMIGFFVGIFCKTRIVVVCFISILPFVLFFISTGSFSLKNISLALTYIFLACITAHLLFKYKIRRMNEKQKKLMQQNS